MGPREPKYRFLLGLIGCVYYLPNLVILDYLDRSQLFGIPFYASLSLHMVASLPGLLLPGKGILTFLLVSAFWGALGYLTGRSIDNKGAQPLTM